MCSKRGEKVILAAASMDIPSKKASPTPSQARAHADHDKPGVDVPADVQRQLPSLAKLHALDECISEKLSNRYMMLDKGSNREYIEATFLVQEPLIDEALCRLAVAQILKDVNYPRSPLPGYVKAAATSVMHKMIRRAGYDTIQLLLSLGPDIDMLDHRGMSLLESICDHWYYSKTAPERMRWEEVAKLLIDEGCDWTVLGNQEEKTSSFVFQTQKGDALRQVLQVYVQQKGNFVADIVVDAK